MSELYNNLYKSGANIFGGGKPEQIVLDAIKLLSPGAKVIEFGAGQGRNALAVAAEGFDVLATDTSEVGIEEIQKLGQDLDLPNLKTEIRDVRSGLTEMYDGIICTFTLHFLSTEEGKVFIESAKAHTSSGGLHVLATFTQDGDFFELPKSKDRFYPAKDELKEFYKDWEIIEYTETKNRAQQSKPDGSPMFNTTARLLARKPL